MHQSKNHTQMKATGQTWTNPSNPASILDTANAKKRITYKATTASTTNVPLMIPVVPSSTGSYDNSQLSKPATGIKIPIANTEPGIA